MKKLDVINFLRGYSIFTIVFMHLMKAIRYLLGR